MILLYGLIEDPPLEKVFHFLKCWQEPVLFVNQRTFFNYKFEVKDNIDESTISYEARTYKLSDFTAAYFRPESLEAIPELHAYKDNKVVWMSAIDFDSMLWQWSETSPILNIVNRASAMASNQSKPFQAEIIRKCGFSIPETLITTSPNAVQAFLKKHQRIIYKSISGVRSIVSEVSKEHLTRLANIVNCPTQFQAYVPGTDYRVHVLGDKLFACKIESAQADYRYDQKSNIEDVILPVLVQEKCLALSAQLGLSLSGIDLRQTPDNEWFCFEVNTSPGYTFFEQAAGQTISYHLADYLTKPFLKPSLSCNLYLP
jgi:glutathione synthase/RimK-type ligase-like ATP-grasp enzyme